VRQFERSSGQFQRRLGSAEAHIEQAVLLAIELDALDRFRSISGGRDLDFLIFKKSCKFSRAFARLAETSNDFDDVIDMIERDMVSDRMCSRASALRSSNCVRRRTTSTRVVDE